MPDPAYFGDNADEFSGIVGVRERTDIVRPCLPPLALDGYSFIAAFGRPSGVAAVHV